MSVYADAAAAGLSQAEHDAVFGDADFVAAAQESGEFLGRYVPADPATGVLVRVRDDAVVLADGPYLDAPIQVAACYLVECEDRERAVRLAARLPAARRGAVEVRPLMTSAAGPEL